MTEGAAAIDAKELTRVFGSFTAVDHITFSVGVGEVFEIGRAHV